MLSVSGRDKEFPLAQERRDVIVCLGAGQGQIPLIRAGQRLGYRVAAVDFNRGAAGFEDADIGIFVSTHNTREVLDSLIRLQEEYEIRGVVARTTAAEALRTAAAIAGEFSLPGLTEELVRIATEKSALRGYCRSRGLPVPAGKRVGADDRAPPPLDFPVIVKPDRTRCGKAGIRVCHTRLDAACVTEAGAASANGMVELEEYIEGIDASCLCWARKGEAAVLCWWDELVGVAADDRVVGFGASVPSVIVETASRRAAEKVVVELVRDFPTADCLLVLSFRISMTGQPFIIELHADLGGDLIAEVLLPAANPAFNFFELAIGIATRGIERITPLKFQPACLRYARSRSGRLAELGGGFSDAILSRKAAVRENLAWLAEAIGSLHETPSVRPRHLEWLELNSATGFPA